MRRFAALLGEFHLSLAFRKAFAVFLRTGVVATVARDAFDEERRLTLFRRERVTAGPAQFSYPLAQAVGDRNALVENEAFAVPKALSLRHLLQIFQDAAFEVEHFFDPKRAHIGRRLLAAYAAGAEHGYLAALHLLPVLLRPLRELAKAVRLGVEGVAEGAERNLVVIARVDDDRVRIGDQRVPVRRFDIGAGVADGIKVRNSHRDDFALEADLHAVERHLVGMAVLDVYPREVREAVEMRDEFADGFGRSGDSAVDSLMRKEKRAAYAALAAEGCKRRAHFLPKGKGSEAVERCDEEWFWLRHALLVSPRDGGFKIDQPPPTTERQSRFGKEVAMFGAEVMKQFEDAGRRLDVEPAALAAVAHIESGGRTHAMIDGRAEPLIRFEGHYFDKRLSGAKRDRAREEKLASPRAGAIANPAAQTARWRLLARAADIDRAAAYESVSWGMGQVMGAHWAWLGYASVDALVAEARTGVSGQLRLMTRYLDKAQLARDLRAYNWAAFAKGYNGPNYRANNYDVKLAQAYRRFSAAGAGSSSYPKIGARGTAVKDLQQALKARGFKLVADGVFGPLTDNAVRLFQAKTGLEVDGVAGPATMTALRGNPKSPGLFQRLSSLLGRFFSSD